MKEDGSVRQELNAHRKKQLVDAENNCGYCYKSSCGCCELAGRCKHAAVQEFDVHPNFDSGPTGFKVVVEPYRRKSAKWALFKWLRDNCRPEGALGTTWLEYMGYGRKDFAQFCRNCHPGGLFPATGSERFGADNGFLDVIDARKKDENPQNKNKQKQGE